MKVGENPKMPYPPCGRSIKTYARGNNDAYSITKYGSPVRLDAQIVALCEHCAHTALRVRVRCRIRSRLRVGVGVRVKVGFKDSVGLLHRLSYVGKGKFFRAPLAPPYVWPVAIDPW